MASRDTITGVSAQIVDPGSGQGPHADLLLDMTSLRGAEEAEMTSPENGDMIPMSPVYSVEMGSDSQPLSPGSDAGRNLAVDYMKSKYEQDKPRKDPMAVPKVIREPKKLDFQWDKVVDEKLKRNDPTVPVIKEQDLVGLMLTFAGLDSGKSQYMSIVENSGRELTPVNREPVEKVAPPEITKKVRDMFETGNIPDIHDSKKKSDTYEVLPGSGVFENEPVRVEGVIRESDYNEEGAGVQRGLTKNLLDHWKTKMTDENSPKTPPNRRIILTDGDETAPERPVDLDWEASHVERGLTERLTGQWTTLGSKEFKKERKVINVADAEGKILENQPVRRSDVIRGDDVVPEGETMQRGLTKTLLTQWSSKGTEETPVQSKRINVACAEGRVAENDPIVRSDVVREGDWNFAEDQVERGLTKNLLQQWNNKDKDVFRLERRAIVVAEDEGRVVENDPVRRTDVVNAYEEGCDDGSVVQKGTTRSLLEQWKTKGSEEPWSSGPKDYADPVQAEGGVVENEPIRRTDVVRESDVSVEGEQIQRGTTRSLLNQWQNKRDEFKKDRTPINIVDGEGVVAENEPTRREDVVREDDFDSTEADRIQRGTTRSLLNQWQNKRDEFKKDRTPIIIDEAEGSVVENDPVRRTDVVREEDTVVDGEILPRGLTKSILTQWTAKSTQQFSIDRNPIAVAEDEGTVAENEPVRRSDVVRADDDIACQEEHQIQKGTTKDLMEKWKAKGTEEFQIAQRNIVIAEDDGRIAENEPERREDLKREYDQSSEVEVKRGLTKNLRNQWMNKGSEEFKVQKRQIIIYEDDGIVAENDPSPRHDVVREIDIGEENAQVQTGFTKKLLGEWKDKGKAEFRAVKKEIILFEDEGVVAENNPAQRSDVFKEGDFNDDAHKIQKGTTSYLLGEWKNKGNEQFVAPKREINLAEDEGKVAENTPIQRSDVIREYDQTVEEEKIKKGFTKSLLGEWKNKGNQQYQPSKREIILAEDEGTVAENQPAERSDLSREYNQNHESDTIQKGYTKNLLGQWKTKGSEEFRAPKREIVLAEDEGKVAENEPVQRSDVVREYDANLEGNKIQRGYTQNLLGQWRNKGNEEYQAPRREIILAEDEGKVSENQPVQRTDVIREYDANLESERIQKGSTKSLLGQWKSKGTEQFVAQKKEIILAEDEGKIAENTPVERSDVFKEYDQSFEGETIQKGYTKNLLGQWKNKGNEEYRAVKKEIILAEDEGKIAENQPVERCDVSKEYNQNYEGESIQKGYTKNLLGQWKNKGSELFTAPRKEIVLAEDEGKVAENEPVQRNDVVREYDSNHENDKIQRGYTKNLLGQWKNKGNEEYQAPRREIILAEDEGTVAENQPVQRSDVIREYDEAVEGDKIQRGTTRNLLGQWKSKASEEYKGPKIEIIINEDEGKIAENTPVERSDVFKEYDQSLEGETIQKGYTKNLLGQWKNKGNEEFRAAKKEIILAEDEGKVAENQPVQRSDVVREYDESVEGEKIQKGYTKNLLGQWKTKGSEEFRAPKREIVLAEDEGKVAENEPVQRSDVVREYDANLEGDKIQRGYTQNLLGQWRNKGNEEFQAPRREIILAEDEGKVSENQPVQRSDVIREYDANLEGERIQKGSTKSLLGQWKSKGTEQFVAQKKEIILAEDEGKIAENTPVERSDVFKEYDQSFEGETIQKGYTKNLLGQWKNKGSESFTATRKEIVLAEDEGKVAENEPVQRNDVVREYDANLEGDKIQRGYTKNLLGQWKNKENEEYQAPRREIILAEDEGTVAENQPVQRSDVIREYDEAVEGDKIQRGTTKNLLGQWKNKGNEEFRALKREIVLAEDEGKIAESQPVQRTDVVREYDENLEGDKIQRGYTKNLLGQWKDKGNEEYRAPKREIILAEDEGKIAENVPIQRSDVVKEYDQNFDGDRIQIGTTRNLLGQWKNKGNEEFRAEKREIILAEDEGKVVENEPITRSDVVREQDFQEEGERIQRGTTRNLLSQWKTKGTQEFQNTRRDIVLAEDEGKVCENDPIQRTDVTRENDNETTKDLPRRGQAKDLRTQWMSSREEIPKERKPVNMFENENEPSVVENNPVVRSDVIREGDDFEKVFLQRGFARNLAGYWQDRQEEDLPKEPFRLETDLSRDVKFVHENTPVELTGVVRCDDPQDEVMGKRGHIQMVSRQYLESNDRGSPRRVQQQIDMDLAEGPAVLENDPVVLGSDVVRSDYAAVDDTSVTSGLAKNMLERWKNQDLENSSPRSPSCSMDARSVYILEMEEAPGSGVFENQPVVRSDVIREDDYEPEMIPVKQTRNTRKLWSRMEQQEDRTDADAEVLPELVRFTPPRELTPPPIHQEDFKSYQSITFASGPSTPGPQSQPGWSAALEERRPQPNQSNLNRPASKKQSSFGGGGFLAGGRPSTNIRPTGMQRVQPLTTNSQAVQNGTQPPETTMRSSAVLILRPS